MKPILQHEQRLQKYANTHPLRVRTTELADHKNKPPFLCSLSLSCAGAGKTAAGPGALQPRSSFVDPQRAASHFPAVQASHSLGRFMVIRHFHECETARAAGFPIVDHGNALNLAEGREQVSQIGFGGFEIQVANVNALHFISPYKDPFASPEAALPPGFFDASRA